jgi:predicted amidophosphoribosyltransferase
MVYSAHARKLILGLKHGDRPEIAVAAVDWLMRVVGPLVQPGMIVAPVPLHRLRLMQRRYNQSALLAQGLAGRLGVDVIPDLLVRHRRTSPQDGKTVAKRFADQMGAMRVHPKRRHYLLDRPVLLVDDVMTSGATLTACTQVCLDAGAKSVFVLALARAVRDD